MSKKKAYPIPGSMRKRATGNQFEFRFRIPKDDGTGTRRLSVYAPTERECIAKAREVLARIEAEMPARDSSESFAALVSLWERTWLPNQGRAQSTIDQYRTLVRVHALPVIGDMRMKAVKPSHLRELLANVDRAASTKRSLYAALSDVFDCAVTDGLLASNPMQQVKRPSSAYREPRGAASEQVLALLNETEGHPWWPSLMVMATTGLRRGEALGITWDDVDLEAGLLHVRQQVTRTSKGLNLTQLKTRNSMRTVPLSAPVIQELRAHRKRQAEARLRVGEMWKDLDLVATTDLGGMVEPRNFSRWYAKCAKRAGLQDTGTHVLRHHFVTRGVHEGSSAVDVSKVVGHSSPAFTLNQYANAIEEGQRRAVESVARSLGLGS